MAKRGRKPKFLGVQCPNPRCRKRPPRVVANGRYQTRDGPVRQFRCRVCGQGFTERQGTFFYDLRTPKATVLMALKLLVTGMPLRGIAEVLGTKLDTARDWLRRAADQSARVNALLSFLPEKYHAVARVAILTGLRMGELRALAWKDVDLGPKPCVTIPLSKAQRTEHVPLNSDAVAILRSLERTSPLVFQALPSHLSDMFKRYTMKAKLEDVTFHTLRHSFCSRLVQAGVPLRMIQVPARHSNIEVTERYAHVKDSHTREAVERLREYEAEARKALEKVTQGATEKTAPCNPLRLQGERGWRRRVGIEPT